MKTLSKSTRKLDVESSSAGTAIAHKDALLTDEQKKTAL